MKYILYNPLSGNGNSKSIAEDYAEKLRDSRLVDLTMLSDYSAFFAELNEADELYLFGGDGTLNRFVNSVGDLEI